MYREDKFVMSHRPYAVDLSSFRLEVKDGRKGDFASGTIGAAWFRRKSGVTHACVGKLHDSQWGVPKDAAHFLERYEDGCYGGHPFARWDGANFWCAGQDPEENARYLELLRPMLAEFPAVPDSYDGWWKF